MLDLTDNQYYSEDTLPSNCNIPTQTQTIMGHSQEEHIPTPTLMILWVAILHLETQQMFNAGMHVVEENMHICMGMDSLERRLTQQKVEMQGKGDKTSNSILES